jgi:hypothetical protein
VKGQVDKRENSMDRKAACLLQAAVCREQALADPINHDYWVDEAIKWLELAHAPASPVVVTIELRPKVRGLAAE